MADIKQFPVKENRPVHVYEFDNCAGCGKDIGDYERFTEIVMTSHDEKSKKHIALCKKCDVAAMSTGIFE